VDNERLWLKTEDMVRRAMDNGGVPYVEVPDEAAFYGPKIDVQIWSAIGREFTLATNQVDFAVPPRFDLVFTNREGKEETPLCIHRAPLSTHERMIGFLLEHYAGAFPVWLAPAAGARHPDHERPQRLRRAAGAELQAAGVRAVRRPERRAHERQDSRRAVDEGALHAGGGRPGDGEPDGFAAQARRLAQQRPGLWRLPGAGEAEDRDAGQSIVADRQPCLRQWLSSHLI
jgi:hypothetical protein